MACEASANFGFLTGYDARLARLGAQAERYFADDPHGTLVKLRLLAEVLTREAAARLGVAVHAGETQSDLLARLRRSGSCPAEVIELFHGVRTVGNAAVHGMEGGHGEALTALKVARQLAIWFHRSFGRGPSFKPGPFRPPQPPPDPAAPLAAEIERLRAERDAASSEAERRRAAAEDEAASRRAAEDRAASAERERAEWESLATSLEADRAAIEARLAGLLQAAAVAPAAEQRAVAQAAQAAARAIELDEADTRDLIDTQLRARGWEANTRTLRFAAGTRPERGRNLAIAEWPTETGPADYALFAGTLCVGVVEAKRKNKDVSGSLKQAERYARGFALHGPAALAPGAPWADGEAAYRVPFVFSANGRPYLKQLETASGIWFRDVRRPTNPARALVDWHEPADLVAMLQQDVAAAEAALTAEPVEFGFPLRPYQRRAIQAVEAALAGGRREMLVAMSTGTGKTKVGIALLYRLLAAGRFRRVCFVVDRTALGEQAEGEFRTARLVGARTFADSFGLVGLERSDVDPETRVHVTTIQGLVRRVLGDGDPADRPAPGQYDLLVVDECHRGYLLDREMSNTDLAFRDQEDYQSQYRRALEYFDAVKIGLTATPAQHTVHIFGEPVFQYKYREAVVDGFLADYEPPLAIETQLAREGIRYRRGDALTLFHPDTGELDLTTAPDDLGFDLDEFNRRVITRPFNAAVCGELARHLDPGGREKTLIFAATDAHADLVVHELREAFRALHGEVENAAIQKITGSVDKAGDLIRAFRNDANPRIAVTVDLLTTGVDVPRITGLVFLRRVGSRILFDQMLGRATRLCDEIGKETFRVFDAVGAYDALRDMTAMKPVAADPRLTFADLLAELARASDPAHLAALRDQVLAKLRARLRRLGPKPRAAWERAAGETPEQTCARLASGDPATLPAWAAHLPPGAGAILDAPPAAAAGPPLPVSDHPDRVVDVRPVFGPDRLAPEDYLSAFGRFVAENANRIAGLHVVTTRPRELTRTDLREIKLALDGAGFREAELQAAWRAARSEDMAAGIVAHIRQAALGDPLRPWAARVEEATGRLLARGDWTAPQRDWLRRIGKRVAEMDAGTADPALLDEGQFKADGGFRRLNRIFDGRLVDVLGDLNEEVWRRTG